MGWRYFWPRGRCSDAFFPSIHSSLTAAQVWIDSVPPPSPPLTSTPTHTLSSTPLTSLRGLLTDLSASQCHRGGSLSGAGAGTAMGPGEVGFSSIQLNFQQRALTFSFCKVKWLSKDSLLEEEGGGFGSCDIQQTTHY